MLGLQCPYKKFARSRYRVRKGKQQSYYLRDLPRGSTRRAGVEILRIQAPFCLLRRHFP